MPWRGPEYPGEFPTLGYEVAQWIEDHAVVPDREDAGQPFRLTDEQLKFLLFHYALVPDTGRWRYERGSQVIRPRKWGKAPLSAVMVCAEAAGPVLFDGWDAAGEPVGKPWPTPWIQCVACSEDQVANVWRVLLPIIQLGSLDADIPDTGATRINLPNNGRIEPVTASARSRFGARTTFAAMDETHLWHASNGGHMLAETLTSNLAGTSGRFIETTNAFDPAEDSTAQRTFEAADSHVYRDDAPAPHGSVRNHQARDKVLRAVYGDALRTKANPKGWVDPDRIHVEIDALLAVNNGALAERMFMNRKLASEGAAFDIEHWRKLAKPKYRPAHGSMITIGVDGARHFDALAIVACEVKTKFFWPLAIIERPANADEDYRHDKAIADGAVRQAFKDFNVWRLYADPQHIADLIVGWSNEFGEKRIIEWETYRPRPIAWAVRNFEQAVAKGDVSHSGDDVLDRHIANARRRKLTVLDDKERQMHTLSKDGTRSPRSMDGAMASTLANECADDCIAAGGVWMGGEPVLPPAPEPPSWTPGEALPIGLLTPSGESAPMGVLS